MTSSESEAQAQRSRKRSRKSNGSEDGAAGGKKARGRPRVDTQDATAADVSGHCSLDLQSFSSRFSEDRFIGLLMLVAEGLELSVGRFGSPSCKIKPHSADYGPPQDVNSPRSEVVFLEAITHWIKFLSKHILTTMLAAKNTDSTRTTCVPPAERDYHCLVEKAKHTAPFYHRADGQNL